MILFKRLYDSGPFALFLMVCTIGILGGGFAMAEDSGQPVTLIFAKHALLVPGEPVVSNVAISVQAGRITGIESPAHPPSSVDGNNPNIIDLSCCFVTPGLIDTQTHLTSQMGMAPSTVRLATWTDADTVLRAMVHARRTLEAGFTTVRDMGNHGDVMFALRDAINQGKVPGPRLQVAGEIIRPTGGGLRDWFRPEVERVMQDSAVCDGADDCRRAVRAQIALGSDTIKVETKMDLQSGSAAQFSLEELRAIAEEAHRHGLKVTASAFSAASINLPIEAGFDAVVHGTFVNERTLELLRSSSAYFIPTLVASRTVREMAENLDTPFSEAWRAENLAIYFGMVKSFRLVYQAGLNIAFGTDAGWRPHGGNGEQLVQMTELGMNSADVIVTATINAADAIGWAEDVGSLEVGKFADMVVSDSSPVEDITQLTQPRAVVKDGVLVYWREQQ